MGKSLERLGEVRIVDETNGFGLDFVKKTGIITRDAMSMHSLKLSHFCPLSSNPSSASNLFMTAAEYSNLNFAFVSNIA